VLLLQGQTILIAGYPLLVAACYVGDALNATAPAFYKTSDAGGTTRSTSGAYFVLPNAQAVSLKGVGNQTINTRVKSGPAFGAVEEDQLENHYHSMTPNSGSNNSPITGGSLVLTNVATVTPNPCIGAVITDGTNSLRSGATTRDNTLGTNFGITY